MSDTNQRIEETLKSVTSNRGVIGYCVVNDQGIPIRSDLKAELKVKISALISQMVIKAKDAVRLLDHQSELQFFRIRTKLHEILVAPDKEYMLIVLQETTQK